MASEETVDEDLRNALTVTPLVHLIPKQVLPPLVNPSFLPEPEQIKFTATNKKINFQNDEVMNILGHELFDQDDEVDNISFRKVSLPMNPSSNLPLSTVETQLIENENDINYVSHPQKYIQCPRLSVRKEYDMRNMDVHNKKYERKFFKEIPKNNHSVKRKIETNEQNHARKLVKFTNSDLTNTASERIQSLLSKPLNDEELELIYEYIKRDIDVELLGEVQKSCNEYSKNAMSELTKCEFLDMTKVQAMLPLFQGCTVASSCILWIMSNNIDSKILLVDSYVMQIADYIYFMINTVLMSLADFSNDGVEVNPKLLQIFNNLGILLRQLGSLNSKMRLEDGVLTKLEIASVQLIFDESFASTDKSLISVLPVNLLKYSAALLIIDIYQFSPDQRQFILNELVMNFLRLPIKKSEVKNCQIERGNSIQLFTMICVRLSQQNAASSLSAELIKRVSEKYNSNSKTILEYLIEDLTSLLVYPEWSASAELLNCLSANLLQTVRSQNCPPLVEVYFLEVLGNICGKILILKNDPQVDIMTQAEALTEVQKYSSPTGTEEYLQSLFKDEQEDSTASYASVVLKELNKFCTIFLNSLGNFLDSPKIKMKTKAIKILSSLSDKHASLLSSPTLQQALSARLCDDATSVRDAVYEFIGNYIRSHPDEADNFYNPICNALGDDGISVRKKAIKLTRQVYSLFSTNAKILIGSRLLKRLNDEEDSVKNESVSVMTDCWIAPLKNGTGNKSLVFNLINLGMSHHKTMESLEFFLQFHILNNAKLSDAVNGLIEILLDIISDDSNFREGALLLLSACTKCKRDLLGQDKLIALQPLILDETNCNKKSYRYVLRILKNVLPSVSSLRPDFINPVQEFLFSKLTKMSHRELHEAIPSLWQLCKIKQNYLKMVNATISTLKMLKKYIDDKQLLDNRVGKLIQLLACLVKYCELESYQEYFFKANIGLKKNESVISLVVKYIISFCQESGHVQTVAVTNLIVVCANHPRILMSPPVLSLFDSALQTTPETIRAVTQEMIDFLNEKDQESINTNKSNLEDIIDDACPGIVQRYISRMLALSLKDKGEYGYLPFQFVQVALQLGFANPKVCISTIIALEASPVSIISSTAISIHKDLFDKHESLVDTNYQEGIKHAFESDLVNVSFLNIVHGIVEGTRGARNKFIQAMLKVLDLNDICLVLFLAERISYIKFKSTEEILMILRRLQDIVHTSNVTDDMDHQVALSTYTIIELYRHLQTVYKVTDEQVELFGSGDLEIDHKHPPKVFKSVTLNLDWIRNNIDNKESTQECIKHIEAFI